MLVATCLVLSFVSLSSGGCYIDPPPPYTSNEARLHDELSNKRRHVPKNTTVAVTLKFLLKSFQFFNDEEQFLLHSWAFLSWHDDCLTWNPADYDHIDNILLRTRNMWTPDIDLDEELGFEFGIFTSPLQRCQVFSTGLVACSPRVTQLVSCNSVLDNWPYDTQTCHFNFTIKNNVNLTFPGSSPITIFRTEHATGWTIVAYTYTHPESLKDTLSLSLTVEREAALLAAINVFPLVVVAVLCLAALFIDVRNTTRVYLLFFCLCCQYEMVQVINENIPKGGVGTPSVMIFFRNSILMSAISIVVTFSLKNLRMRTKTAPTWVIQMNDFVLKGARRKFVWPKWEAEFCEDDVNKKTLEEWNSLSFVLNFYFLIVYILMYFIWYLVYIPRPMPVSI